MTTYKVVTESQITPEEWWAYTDAHPHATLFHTPMMHEAFSGIPKLDPFALFALDEAGKIVGMINGHSQRMLPILPSFIAKRIVIMQSPLCDSGEALQSLLCAYKRINRFKGLYSEIRNHYDMAVFNETIKGCGFTFEEHLNIFIDLGLDEEVLWQRLNKSSRKRINKAKREGIVFKELGFTDLEDAYGLLQKVYERERLPLFDISFFRKCLELSGSDFGLRVYGAFFEDKIIGTRFTLQYKDQVYAYFAGSDSDYYHLSPNEFLPWEVFMDAKKKRMTLFDFGGAGKPGIPYGVRDYKMKFGGELVNFGRHYYMYSKALYKVFQFAFEQRKKFSSKRS